MTNTTGSDDTWTDFPSVEQRAIEMAQEATRTAREAVTISQNAQAMMLDLIRDCLLTMHAAANAIDRGDGDEAVTNLRASVASLGRLVRPLNMQVH